MLRLSGSLYFDIGRAIRSPAPFSVVDTICDQSLEAVIISNPLPHSRMPPKIYSQPMRWLVSPDRSATCLSSSFEKRQTRRVFCQVGPVDIGKFDMAIAIKVSHADWRQPSMRSPYVRCSAMSGRYSEPTQYQRQSWCLPLLQPPDSSQPD